MSWSLLWLADFPQHGLHEKETFKMGFELNVLSSYEDDKLGTRDSCEIEALTVRHRAN